MQETVEDGSFFCFQGADFEVHPAKIIQTEVAFCKTEVKFAIYRYLPLKMHIPQELRIRSRGTERHSASD